MTNDQKGIVGFLCGVAAGAIAGILLAPESGKDTRKKLAAKAKDLRDDLNEQFSGSFGRIADKVSNLGWGGDKESACDHTARKMAREGVDS